MLKIRLVKPGQRAYARRVKHEDWELHRDKLMRLHACGVPRHVIIDTLSREDDFHPSTAQLNARFYKWGLRCYDKPPPVSFHMATRRSNVVEKGVASIDVHAQSNQPQSTCNDADSGETYSESNGTVFKPVKTISNQSQQKANEKPCIAEVHPVRDTLEINGSRANRSTDVSATSNVPSPPSRFFEPALIRSLRLPNQLATVHQVLECIDAYLLSLLEYPHINQIVSQHPGSLALNSNRDNGTPDEVARYHANIFNAYDDGFQSLRLGLYTKGRLRLHAAGEMVRKMLERPSIWLLISILNITTRLNWNEIPQHRHVVLAFLAAVCHERLGGSHPFTIMTRLFCNNDVADSGPWHLSFWACLTHHIDRLSRHINWSRRNHLLKFEANEAYVKLLRKQGLLDSALVCASNLRQHYSLLYGPMSDLAAWSNYEVARTHNDLGEPKVAFRLFTEISKQTGDNKLRAASIQWLAVIAENGGDHESAAVYHQKAFLERLQYCGPQDTRTLTNFRNTIDCLQGLGWSQEAASIKRKYPTCWALLNAG